MISRSTCLSLSFILCLEGHNTLQAHPCCCKWQNFILFYGWAVFHYTLIYLTVYGYLGCFYTLAIVNNASMNIGVHISFQISVFFSWYIPRIGIAGSCASSILSFFKKPVYCFPQWLHQFIFPSIVYKGSFFSTSLPTLAICVLFDDSHSNRCEGISHCGFDFHFPGD